MKLEELEKLCEAATPINNWNSIQEYSASGAYEYATGPWHNAESSVNSEQVRQDAEFIDAAREYMPKLIEVVKAAKIVLKRFESSDSFYALSELDSAVEELENP